MCCDGLRPTGNLVTKTLPIASQNLIVSSKNTKNNIINQNKYLRVLESIRCQSEIKQPTSMGEMIMWFCRKYKSHPCHKLSLNMTVITMAAAQASPLPAYPAVATPPSCRRPTMLGPTILDTEATESPSPMISPLWSSCPFRSIRLRIQIRKWAVATPMGTRQTVMRAGLGAKVAMRMEVANRRVAWRTCLGMLE